FLKQLLRAYEKIWYSSSSSHIQLSQHGVLVSFSFFPHKPQAGPSARVLAPRAGALLRFVPVLMFLAKSLPPIESIFRNYLEYRVLRYQRLKRLQRRTGRDWRAFY